tara:strand:+ start:3006 stop:4385 length:1380 start_codon:yes stop_codon:yes gene_type:complete
MGNIIISSEQLETLVESLNPKKTKVLSEAVLGAPLKGSLKVNSGFSKKRCLKGQKCRPHNGTDYKADYTQAYAIADGTVSKTNTDKGACGGMIVIKHDNGYKSSYCHMSRIDVKKNEKVTKGQLIGITGGDRGKRGSGNSLGAHLHFGLKYKNKWVDPEHHILSSSVVVEPEVEREKGTIILWDGCGDRECSGGSGPEEMNDQVEEMQTDLIARNYILPEFGIDGRYGPETLAAINAFQRDYFPSDIGEVVTPQMLKAMKDETKVNKKPQENDPNAVKNAENQGLVDPNANFVLPLSGKYYPGSVKVNPNTIIEFFIDKGLTAPQAAGITGNIKTESAGTWQTGVIGDGGTSMGLAQWHKSRLLRLNQFANNQNLRITDPTAQLEYLWYEFQNKENKAYRKLLTTTTPEDAAISFMVNFERPASANNPRKRKKRANQARKLYNKFYSKRNVKDRQQRNV